MSSPITETVTLSQAKELIRCLAHEQSLLILSPPGVGKSDVVRQAAADATLECKSLLGTQIAPEDVSGVPRIIGERSVFCPPRVLLPDNPAKFCLFLDELPACARTCRRRSTRFCSNDASANTSCPKERGSSPPATGPRTRRSSRTISSALVNRVLILNIRIDVPEWLAWAQKAGLREDITRFIEQNPDALLRPVPDKAAPFSTPRAWASLSRALELVGARGKLTGSLVRALAVGRVSEDDARRFAATWMGNPAESVSLEEKLNWTFAELDLSVRATNCLESEGIERVRDLVLRTEDELLEVRNFGETTLREVKSKLALHGLSLGMKLGS